MRPSDFHTFLNRFHRPASDTIVAHDGIVDKVLAVRLLGPSSAESAGRTTQQ